ncbi:hypothetical protein [Massilia sp. CF038]|uniref:hypothetical protein n=1 Tax=Massilia sp. CF038 TaxID=1881045 RepID=UPI00091823F6|nr:hypothetical protein [Massilia sp. CF038]SHH17171.1 hypothetical protein SAMN05428948_3139 [Massilia sp. CF038]
MSTNEMQSTAFVDHASAAIAGALAGVPDADLADIYALSLFVFEMDDDPRQSMLQLGFNTRAQLASQIPFVRDPQEAKWNFAFWLQNELLFIGEPGTPSGDLLEALLRAQGLWYTDEQEDANFEACTPIAEAITARFVALSVAIARNLHTSGLIERRFGRPIPVIVHELEYYDEIVEQTAAANPPGLSAEFSAWVAGQGSAMP